MKNIWKLSLLAVMLVLARSDSLTLTPTLTSNPTQPQEPSQHSFLSSPATSPIVIPAVNNAVPLQDNTLKGKSIVESAEGQPRAGNTGESQDDEDDGQKANGGTEEEKNNSSGENEAAKNDPLTENTQHSAEGNADEPSKNPSGSLPANAPQQPNQGAPTVELVMPADKANAPQTTDSPVLSNLQKFLSNLFGTTNQAPEAPANTPNSQIPNPPILMVPAPSSLTADPVKNDTPQNKPEEKQNDTPQNKPEEKQKETPQNKPEEKQNDTPQNKPEEKQNDTPQNKPEKKQKPEEQSEQIRKDENEKKSEVESLSDETWKVQHIKPLHHEEDSSSEIESESQHKQLNGLIFRKHHVHRRHHHGIPQNKKVAQNPLKHENMPKKKKQKQVKHKTQSEKYSEKYSENKSEDKSENKSQKSKEKPSEKSSYKSSEKSSQKSQEKSSQKSQEISSEKSSPLGQSKRPLLKKESTPQGESYSGYSRGTD